MILGTAEHIDRGTTTLNCKLTGVDARIKSPPVGFFAHKAPQVCGGVPLPVGRPDFKSGWGRQTVSGGFDSHPPPPSASELQQ